MEIKVIRKKEVLRESVNDCVTLLFKKTHLRTKYTKVPIVTMYDEKGEYLPVSVKLTQVQSRVPSVLLSKWINANCAEKLLTLVDKANTIEKIDLDKDESSKWFFTNLEDSIYGLHKLILMKRDSCQDVKFEIVKIDDSIGMKSVEAVLKLLGISIDCMYSTDKGRMVKIHVNLGDVRE